MTPATTPRPLDGVRVIEVSSFVAAPTAGLTLQQLGAEVIRIDPIGGAADVDRWPLSDEGRSIYWAGLNRGKRSVELDLSTGPEIVADLLVPPDAEGGVLISNLAGRSWLTEEVLRERCPDLVHVQVLGWADGSPAVDYTVNAWTGLPRATGPAEGGAPVNHALPAWDLLCGMHAAVAVLGGVMRRRRHGVGCHVTVSLEDVAAATLTTLGFLPEAWQTGRPRPALGNDLYGTYGCDFDLSDGGRVMVVAVTDRQWHELLHVTGTTAAVAALAQRVGADFADDGDRYRHREDVNALLRPWFSTRSGAEVAAALDATHVLWAPFRRLTDLASDLAGGGSDVVIARDEAGLGPMLATAGPLRWHGEAPVAPAFAPTLGADTARVIPGGAS